MSGIILLVKLIVVPYSSSWKSQRFYRFLSLGYFIDFHLNVSFFHTVRHLGVSSRRFI